MPGGGGRRAHPADGELYGGVVRAHAGGHALFEVMLAMGLLSTAILGALAAEWSMARASRAAGLREQAWGVADTRAEAERSGAQDSLDWASRTRTLPYGDIEITPVEEGMQRVTVKWGGRAAAGRHHATLAYGSEARS